MTAVDGPPAAAADTQKLQIGTSPQGDVPALVGGTQLLGVQPGSGYVNPPQLVCRADGQVMHVTRLLYAVLEAIDGERSLAQIARLVSSTTDREVHPDDIEMLVEEKLRPLGLVLRRDGTHPPLQRSNPLLALRARFVVSKPEVTRRITAPFAVLFNPALVVVATIAFALVSFWVLFEKGLASAAYDAFRQPGLLLAVFGITVVSAGFHEFGHAAALRRGGGTPGAMGAGLYLIYPAFYTDVTDSYRLGRGARIRTDLGGLYFNALVALAMFGVWVATRWDGLLLVIAAQILQMVRQLPPLVRFDGYHLLADVTGVPDLFHRIGPTLRSFLPRRWRRPDSRELKLWARVIVTLWTLVVVPVLLLTMLLSVIALPRIIGTTIHSVRVQWHQLLAQQHAGHVAGVGVKVLAIAALVIPVGGILYLLARMVRSYGVRMWRGTRGKPGKRVLAGLLTAAMLGGLAYAWFPRHGVYRPIQPYERGTIQDAVGSSTLAPLGLAASQTSLRVGEQRTARTIWPAGSPMPTAEHPVPALVMTPKQAGSDLPTWVFPFDRPAPPNPGDNQAMSIVTTDGGTAYDVAFALVWADSDTVVNANEAYAFASCDSCVAVAVAFQVVVVVGDAHLVAPENIAVAVNYSCVSCVTAALAVQLVLQVPDQLSDEAMAQLTKLWAQIMAWSKHLEGLTFAQIQAKIKQFEDEIIAIVQPELLGPSASPSPGSEVTTIPSAAGSAVPSDGATAAPSASASSSPAPSSSDGSSASETKQPSPSPSDSGGTPTPTSTP